MTLHTVGPASIGEDEQKIGTAYQTWLTPVLMLVPFVVAQYADVKWVIATGIAILAVQQHEAGGRLHDLCIRVRRTNILLRDKTRAVD